MAKYEIEVEDGTRYEVETEEPIVKQSIPQQLGQSFGNIAKGIINPPYRIAAHGLQGLESLVRGGQATPYQNPLTGDVVQPYTSQTKISEPIGLGLQGAALLLSPGVGGAMFGAGGAMEQGGNAGQVGLQALLGGALGKGVGLASGEPLLTGKLGQLVGRKLQTGAEKSYQKVLGATTKPEKILAGKVAPELTKRKPFVWTRQGLKNVAEKKTILANESLEEGYKSLGAEAKVAVGPILDNISANQNKLLINGILPPENKALNTQLDKIGQTIIDIAKTDKAPLSAIRQYRQTLDKSIADSKKGFSTVSSNAKREAQRISGNVIRKELAKQQPSLARLNSEFSFWKSMNDLLETTAPKEKTLISHIGGAVGNVSGNPAFGLFMRNLGSLVSDNVAWNSFSGSMKVRLANQLTKGNLKAANFTVLKGLRIKESK